MALPGAAAAADGTKPSTDREQFFERRIRPLLLARCGACHDGEKAMSGLRLNSRSGLLQGGGRGPAIVPGRPDASLLIAVVRHADGVPKMPPTGRLTNTEIGMLERWVEAGAFWPPAGPPGSKAKSKGRNNPVHPSSLILHPSAEHWAFRPMRPVAVPSRKNRAWVRTPIDAFILQKLEARGLRPAPPADRRTLIRRVTFDMTGLPPTPEEIEAFVNDRSPDAWPKVVERLLASPHYGERWGRHWLDVARYADSNGLDENVAHGNAWRYRDYVVRAFNADRPFDQFVLEQIAGDLLPALDTPTRHERLIATGYLALGPKVLAEVDKKKLEMDIVDEQIDTIGRTFMGMTLGCARCHDHKFDPISTQDYYALAGIFKSTRTMESLVTLARWHEHSLTSERDQAELAAFQDRIKARKAEIAALVARGTDALKAADPAKEVPTDPERAFPESTRAELKRLRDDLARIEKEGPNVPMAMGVTEGVVADVPVHIRGSHLTLGDVVPRRFPTVLASQGPARLEPSGSGRLDLARWLVSRQHPLTARVLVNRVWRWHFGRGIVATPDNFGLRGEAPSHPELLDWLALELVKEKWSLKAIHRTILRSNVYQMSSGHDARAARADPENELMWRAPVRRLEAEEIRDALLAISGRLDRTIGGSLLHVKNREFFFDHTSKDTTNYVSPRRSIYLPVVRNHLYDVFQLFDFGDGAVPEGNRASTTVAPQALFMLNSSMVTESAASLAGRLMEHQPSDDSGRIRELYLRALGRPATIQETERAARLLGRLSGAAGDPDPLKRRLKAWAWLCHTVLGTNEFLFVR